MTKYQNKMKTILNICLNGPYTEGFTYQDNLLPKYHKALGYNVVVFAPAYGWGKAGTIEHVGESDYLNKDGVRVIRMENDQLKPPTYRFKTFHNLYSMIDDICPDIIFLHGLQMRDSSTVAKYVREHPGVRLFVDNHADYSNSASNWFSKFILHRVIWRRYATILEPITSVFWGVLPARVDFLVENYGLSSNKCRLLVMGADDEEVSRASSTVNRLAVRNGFGFNDSHFVIVTGGKIDSAKRQTLELMDAIALMDNRFRLLIFGPVAPELMDEFEDKFNAEKMAYVPWASASDSYDYFAAGDLICFPGRHSVYWEEAAAMSKPMIVRDWPGTHHIDCGGNAIFLASPGVYEIKSAIESVASDSSIRDAALLASRLAAENFLYSRIARLSITD